MSIFDKNHKLPKNLEEFNTAMEIVSKISCNALVAYLTGETLPYDETNADNNLKNLEFLGEKDNICKVIDKISQKYENILRSKTVGFGMIQDDVYIFEKKETVIQELYEQVDWCLFPELKSTQEKEEYIKTNMYSISFLQCVYWSVYTCSYEYDMINEHVDNYIDEEYERELNMKYMKKYCR